MERRAAQAYALGDAPSAIAQYEAAAQVYESLALPEPLARARLSVARVLAESGQTARAEQIIEAIVADSKGLGADTLALAYGRASVLQLNLLQSKKIVPAIDSRQIAQAQRYWQSADSECKKTCSARTALQVLRARIDLAQGQANAAVLNASAAIIEDNSPGADAVSRAGEKANALRVRAQAYATLGNHALALADAAAALPLDQDIGHSSRVIADLDLISAAHLALGDVVQAHNFSQRAKQARVAAQALQRGAP